MIRSPAVAHQFYPGDPVTLQKTLSDLIPPIDKTKKRQAFAVVSPHAGYIYSGACAGETFANVIIPEDVVILGPNHHGHGTSVALYSEGSWDMPMGSVPINEDLANLINDSVADAAEDHLAHRFEHSLEVQVPFLQFLQPDIKIVPMVISHIPYTICEEVGKGLAQAIKKYSKSVLVVASSDMTHYESRETATKKDSFAIQSIEAMDPTGLYQTIQEKNISMCGFIPATIALVAAMELGATKSELIRYTDSGETSGDTLQVVGYAGFVIS